MCTEESTLLAIIYKLAGTLCMYVPKGKNRNLMYSYKFGYPEGKQVLMCWYTPIGWKYKVSLLTLYSRTTQ